MATGDNSQFTRFWHEINRNDINFRIKRYEESLQSFLKWVPYSKGGGYRKWYGFAETVVYWNNGGISIREFKDEKGNERSRFRGYEYYFLAAATWGLITSSNFSCRFRDIGYVFDIGGMSAFVNTGFPQNLVAFLNTKIVSESLKIINPTLNYQIGDIAKLPLSENFLKDFRINQIANDCIEKSKSDWDSYETSWDFTSLPLLNPQFHAQSIESTYNQLRQHWKETTDEMLRLEEENNSIFIEAYGLQDELKPDVPLEEITLTCNPAYRYGGQRSSDELEEQLKADTMREFISYAVGCMFGRYSLDQPGLILANQGEGLEDYLQRIPEPRFAPDKDNVIPILDGDWFTDDIADRFDRFLKLTFGEEQFATNRAYIEAALGKKGKPQNLRDYFLKDFYADHLKRYKKRPIYWLFSSPKGSFNALIYMHRYRPDTVSVVLNDYLRELIKKVNAQLEHEERMQINEAVSKADKSKAFKNAEKFKKILSDLQQYEYEVLYNRAAQKIEIDLDEGVKVNYLKFGESLKKIPGLEAKED